MPKHYGMWSQAMSLFGISGIVGFVVWIERWLSRTDLRAFNHEYEMLCAQMSDVGELPMDDFA